MYQRAKGWHNLAMLGVGGIAIAAPIITTLSPDSAEAVGAVAGAWLFLARTWFAARRRHWVRTAAAVQEQFDRRVFGLEFQGGVLGLPRPEDIVDFVPENLDEVVRKEHLRNWYEVEPDLPGAAAVAILQRSNAAYSQRLQQRHSAVLLAAAAAWAAVAVGLGARLTLGEFLVGIVLPVLPAVLDAQDLWWAHRQAAEERGQLADILDKRIREWAQVPLRVEELQSVQEQQYRLRRDGPLVPDLLYRRARDRDAQAVAAASRELAAAVRHAHRVEHHEHS
jgi:hypothetical protein